jgi:CheY-like chemotaxis protein
LTSWRGNESKLSSAGWHLYLEPPVPPHRLFEALVAVVEKGSEEVGSAGLLTQRDLDEATLETTRSVVDEKILNDSRPPSHVLVAEDNRVNQKLVVRLLEKLGCTVDVAHDGREAVERLQKAEYDLVLMDCQMPEMDGYQATQAIRDRERDSGERIPIIALTANAMEGDRERCLDAGMDDYVTKPVSRKALDAVLAKWSDGA